MAIDHGCFHSLSLDKLSGQLRAVKEGILEHDVGTQQLTCERVCEAWSVTAEWRSR